MNVFRPNLSRARWKCGCNLQEHLRRRFCWKLGFRYIFITIVWASVTTYIWISSWMSRQAELREDTLLLSAEDVPKKTFHPVPQLFPPATFFNESKTDLHLNNGFVNKLDQDAQNKDLRTVYQKKWVGFPDITVPNCQAALHTKTNNNLFPQTVKRILPSQYILESQECATFVEKYGYNRYPQASQEERDYPIAFIILFYKDLDQVLFLLRALYQPHNVYCLSVDTKSSIEFLEAVRSISRCLPNVFVASRLENIVYAGFTRLMADIDCMEDLLINPVQWKYVINMPGQQFPLRTNLEFVRILKIFNGGNDIEGLTGDMLVADRFLKKHINIIDKETGELRVKNTFVPNDPPPHGLEMIKGSTYGTFSRAFVEFALRHPIAKDFLEWCKNIKSPDEYFWGTLHHSKVVKVPGGFTGEPHKKPWLTSFSLWETNPVLKCATIYVHKICIFSPEDFPTFINKGQLFANKFYITHHPAALHCLDELLVNLTFSGVTRDLSFYHKVPFAIKEEIIVT